MFPKSRKQQKADACPVPPEPSASSAPLLRTVQQFGSCDRNVDFFRDLILMEVSELNGIVWFIIGSVCKQFCLC